MIRDYAEVIGDPIAHSKSPLIHGFWLGKLGLDGEYRACHVRPDGLAQYLDQRRQDPAWRGCNVTIPHKIAVCDHVAVDAKASAVGAVNTVIHRADGPLTGSNTDVDGVVSAVGEVSLAGRKAVIIGAGGAARAAMYHLSRLPLGQAVILARSPDKARAAASECGLTADAARFEPASGAFGGAALVINATQLGMTGQSPMPAFVLEELASMAPQGHVFDMVYSPLETEFLKAARALGMHGADGLTMLIGQAAVAFEHFFGHPAPREHDGELRGLLTA